MAHNIIRTFEMTLSKKDMRKRVLKHTSSGLSLTKVICISSATTAIIIAIKYSTSTNIVYILYNVDKSREIEGDRAAKVSFGS